MQSTTEWAQLNFGTCQLGDKRRTKRLLQVAEQIGNNPSASLPNQIERWSDLKAAYRLFDGDKVAFEAIARPHWELTKQAASGRCLVIGDTTEFDFGKDRDIQGIGPTSLSSGVSHPTVIITTIANMQVMIFIDVGSPKGKKTIQQLL